MWNVLVLIERTMKILSQDIQLFLQYQLFNTSFIVSSVFLNFHYYRVADSFVKVKNERARNSHPSQSEAIANR